MLRVASASAGWQVVASRPPRLAPDSGQGYNDLMINTLTIRRFKSIKEVTIACKKVNLFIGAPDTGKTNILEALNLLSRLGWSWPLDATFRLGGAQNFEPLFFRQFFDQPFEIIVDDLTLRATIEGQDRRLRIRVASKSLGMENVESTISYGGTFGVGALQWIRYYSYTQSESWQYQTGFLQGDRIVATPHGWNLIYIARHNEKVYAFLKEIVSGLKWKLKFDQAQKKLRFSEVREDEIVEWDLDLLSDSLKRLFFYGAILLSTEGATLVFDEPDVYAFPPYPKTLGEMIARDQTNQFFLTTHNPYFLAAIVEKTPAKDLALFVCDRDPEQGTRVRSLTTEEIEQVIDQGASVFFNLNDYIKAQ